MKKNLLLLAIFPLIICNGQSKSPVNGFVNSVDLKGKVWHVGKSHGINEPGGIIFSTDIYLYFLDKDRIQMTYSQYTPSVGFHSITTNGIYFIERKNEVSIIILESKEALDRSKVTIGEHEVQLFLYAMNRLRNPDEPAVDIMTLPEIKTYRFTVTNYLPNGDFRTELNLFDERQVTYPFGIYTFDGNKTVKQP